MKNIILLVIVNLLFFPMTENSQTPTPLDMEDVVWQKEGFSLDHYLIFESEGMEVN